MSPTFAQAGVPADLAASLARRGITQPFAIQAAAIPDAINGRDIAGKAPTGSGKTLAFGIPLVARVGKARANRPRALVLVPTRELAAQVAKELKPLAGTRGRTVAAFYGGTGYGPQRSVLRSGCEIVVACPGRLEDLIRGGDVSLADVDIVVVDEADRMADMGFLPVVKRLLDQVKPDRQTLLFSATLDGDIDTLVRRYQKDPVRHELAVPEDAKGDVEHRFWRVDRAERVNVTASLVQREWPAIVFCRTKHGADRVARQLAAARISAVAIHGDRSQSQRERALADFRSGKAQALVATDVAARGIHVDDVACVVHFDPPEDEKAYVHRSGRTGRAGAEGLVVSLVCDDGLAATRALQRALGLPVEATTPDGRPSVAPAADPALRPRVTTARSGRAGHASRADHRDVPRQARSSAAAPGRAGSNGRNANGRRFTSGSDTPRSTSGPGSRSPQNGQRASGPRRRRQP